MKLGAKKRCEIYDLFHDFFREKRREMNLGILKDNPDKDKIDYQISQLEIPLAQALMRLLDKDYDNPYK